MRQARTIPPDFSLRAIGAAMRIPDKNWLLSEASTKTSPPLSPVLVISTGRNPGFPDPVNCRPELFESFSGRTDRALPKARGSVEHKRSGPRREDGEKKAGARAAVPEKNRSIRLPPAICRWRHPDRIGAPFDYCPNASSALAVRNVSSAFSGLPISAGPCERAAIMSARWVIDLDPGSRICAFIFETDFMVLRRFFIYGFFQGLSHRRDGGSFEDRTFQPPFELSGPLVQQHVQTGHHRTPCVPGGP